MVGIYKIISPSNKIYIGQSTNIDQRWYYYKKLYCKSQTKLYYSLKKYTPENHNFTIIEECSENMLLERETYWKNFYKVLEIPSLCCRADGKGGKLSNKTKLKMSISAKKVGVGKWNKGRKQSLEEKQLRSKIKKGTKLSKSHTKNMRKGMLGKNVTPILCITDNKSYLSIREAAKILKLNERSIQNHLAGLTKSLKNKLQFKYINNH
jgi:group I intron endonuclease